VAAVFLIFN